MSAKMRYLCLENRGDEEIAQVKGRGKAGEESHCLECQAQYSNESSPTFQPASSPWKVLRCFVKCASAAAACSKKK